MWYVGGRTEILYYSLHGREGQGRVPPTDSVSEEKVKL